MFSIDIVSEKYKMIMYEWRIHPEISKYMINDSMFTLNEHNVWFKSIIDNDHNYYFALLWKEIICGFGNITDINKIQGTANWGIYLSPYNVPNIFSGLVLYCSCVALAFDRLQLKMLNGKVLSNNKNVLSLHRQLGLVIEEKRLNKLKRINGKYLDVYLIKISKNKWELEKDNIWLKFPQNFTYDLKRFIENRNN